MSNAFPGPVLCIVSHPDDEILGFGATANKFKSSGINVETLIISGQADKRFNGDKEEILKTRCKKACNLVGIKNVNFGTFPNLSLHNVDSYNIVNFIETSIKKIKPQTIFTHHPKDLNIDHKVVSELTLAAARLPQRRPDLQLPLIKNIFFMEILSSTDWAYANSENFDPNVFISVTENDLNAKVRSLKCYENVERDRPHPRNEETIKALAKYRGSQCGKFYAEAFVSCFSLYDSI